jgi:hypothetical protein
VAGQQDEAKRRILEATKPAGDQGEDPPTPDSNRPADAKADDEAT